MNWQNPQYVKYVTYDYKSSYLNLEQEAGAGGAEG